jgi:hypothetical protein
MTTRVQYYVMIAFDSFMHCIWNDDDVLEKSYQRNIGRTEQQKGRQYDATVTISFQGEYQNLNRTPITHFVI